jgi:hypothetical protein
MAYNMGRRRKRVGEREAGEAKVVSGLNRLAISSMGVVQLKKSIWS